ncbi:GNAT family N-acetyltransferase [Pararhodobacter zhoushanensis]|uniref:GNAT family N-acetyltransferase n=1 Tax=Pararhodobacter zhoushanensis TaxID=2479545 RepID=UPI00319E4ED5
MTLKASGAEGETLPPQPPTRYPRRMTPDALATLHGLCFTAPPPWSVRSFANLLDSPFTFLTHAAQGRAFALGRVIAGEAELLTLATDPDARRQGLARAQLAAFDAGAKARGAGTAFLEVAEDNIAARALYEGAGWVQTGRRPAYYVAVDGRSVAALILCKSLA